MTGVLFAIKLAFCVALAPAVSAEKAALRLHAHREDDGSNSEDGNLQWAESAAQMLASYGITSTAGPEANFCRNGKLLPSFYLLGGPKCATTSAAMELGRYGGIRAAPQLWSRKEWHFWEKYAPGTDHEKVRRAFRKQLGKCPNARLVLGDFSVNNLAAVPAPSTMELSPCSCEEEPAMLFRSKGHNGGDVPRLLNEVYGDDIGEVTLMMLIRDPVSRIQSSWYHARAENFASYWGFRDCCTESLNKALQTIIDASDKTQDPPAFSGKLGGEGSVWFSLFGRHIEEYLNNFNATQLVIVPYKQYLARDSRIPICADLRARLNIGLNCTNHDDFHENIHPHPPLEEDLDEDVLNTFKRMFEPEQKHLVQVLSAASLAGANLAGFKGKPGNKKQVEAWLTENW